MATLPMADATPVASVGTLGSSHPPRFLCRALPFGALQGESTTPSPSERGLVLGGQKLWMPKIPLQRTPQAPEEVQDHGKALATLSSSLDETGTGLSIELVQDNYKVHQELLWRMAQNLSLQAEETEESTHYPSFWTTYFT